MKDTILFILKDVKLDIQYIDLCNRYKDFDNRVNLNRKEAEPIIKSFDSHFKYLSKDRAFLKEISLGEFIVRFFIGFKDGIVGFGYLIWKEGQSNNYYKGNLLTLSKLIDPKFEDKVEYNSPIATSLDDFKEILAKIFFLYKEIEKRFKEQDIDIV